MPNVRQQAFFLKTCQRWQALEPAERDRLESAYARQFMARRGGATIDAGLNMQESSHESAEDLDAEFEGDE
jgi:hypothetical protein